MRVVSSCVTQYISKRALPETRHGSTVLRGPVREDCNTALAITRAEESIKVSHNSLEIRSVTALTQVDDQIARATRICDAIHAAGRGNATVFVAESE